MPESGQKINFKTIISFFTFCVTYKLTVLVRILLNLNPPHTYILLNKVTQNTRKTFNNTFSKSFYFHSKTANSWNTQI